MRQEQRAQRPEEEAEQRAQLPQLIVELPSHRRGSGASVGERLCWDSGATAGAGPCGSCCAFAVCMRSLRRLSRSGVPPPSEQLRAGGMHGRCRARGPR